MVGCPKCGEPLVKRIKSKYFCENESCPVIFVRCPHEPARMRVAFTALTRERTIGKIEETIAKSRSHVFWTVRALSLKHLKHHAISLSTVN